MAIPLQESHCIFCDIIQGAAEVSVCYEDSTALAFMDIQPVNPGHLLVVSRDHYEKLEDLPPELAAHLFKLAMDLSPVVRQVAGSDALNLVVSSGRDAGQDVDHFHIHLIPRRAGDGFEVQLPFNGADVPPREQLEAMAARIVSTLRDPVRRRPTLAAAS